MRRLLSAFFLALLLSGGSLKSAAAEVREPVDVVLVLAADVSRSMSPRELAIQREGYAAALAHPDFIAAIRSGAYQRIGIVMFEWAGDFSIAEIFPWTLVESEADAARLAEIVRNRPMAAQRRTSISGAIRHAAGLIEEAPFEAFRKVIDVSGDGPNNQGDPVTEARADALAAGIVINGLPLLTQDGPGGGFNIEQLDQYYQDCVIGGPGSFLLPVTTWEQFPEAVRRKLILEIGFNESDAPAVIPVQAREPADCLIGEKIWQQRQWMWDDSR